MNIKLTGLALGAALSALAFSACESASNTNVNVNKAVNGNSNTNVAVVVPNNTNANVTVAKSNSWNANITKEEYEKDKDGYANKAKEEGAKIGSGAEDAWLWTKTRTALATTSDLRDSTINVDVDNSVITLKGTVATAAQKTKAGEVAKGVKDVKSVTNDLKVQAGDSMTNQMVNGNTKSNTNATTNANAKK